MITLEDREMTAAEFARVQAAFRPDTGERHTVVALDAGAFRGCASGLRHHRCFYLTDLWIEERLRRRGLGTALLERIEKRVAALGVCEVYLWTAEAEAPAFYRARGYRQFVELENYYPGGQSRFGFAKRI